ncbi:Acyl-CoA N-acyltransferases (Nat) [Colletotrichum scovillei]|uniref:Acyl-CoA N-acyltransferases (Nat) n=1 Tax=Colletotrichum scovillei TaxID=1209932 RepID=A0A9P7QY68_9PEZI|nr:Acyl-CoA N-acyltransferases (Nat) [Colletotrichum scovillei]KAG7052479.1 Acyl-CoA N-acyltransferases (Nat) [Colletotrichum scovillei]KAG7064769.1 Acyl-CoA N-acyltransferases (Nat) [Colletotrichum scovillei]
MHSQKMHLEVRQCTENDIPRVFEIVSLAFANDHEFVDAVFPEHSTSEGRKLGSERMLAMFHGDPYSIFLKCIDTNTGQIVAAAKWNVYKDGPVPPLPELGGDYWKNDEEKRFAQAIFRSFLAPRQRAIEESGARLVALDMLMCDPEFQCQGAGRLLVRAGLAIADEMGVDAVVEGSDRGRRLYASEGFDGPHYVCPVPDEFAARRKQTYWWMRRPKTSI